MQTISAFWSVKPWGRGRGNPFIRCKFTYGKNTALRTVDSTGCRDQHFMRFIVTPESNVSLFYQENAINKRKKSDCCPEYIFYITRLLTNGIIYNTISKKAKVSQNVIQKIGDRRRYARNWLLLTEQLRLGDSELHSHLLACWVRTPCPSPLDMYIAWYNLLNHHLS